MPLYLMLTTLTEKGVQTLNSNPARLREVNRDIEELGAKVLHQWASLGEYDFVNIVEAPDDLTVARVSVALGARGSSKLESLPLIPVDELLSALESLARQAAWIRLRRADRLQRAASRWRYARSLKPVGSGSTVSGLDGSPGSASVALKPPGATSFGVSGWNSAASSWIWPRPGPSSN
jgi:uncharacterized protein with GYD domain